MGKNPARILIFLFVITVFNLDKSIAAQEVVPEKTTFNIRETVNRSYGNFNISFEYDTKKAWAGNDNLDLKIGIQADGANNLRLVECKTDDRSPIKVIGVRGGGQRVNKDDSIARNEYRCQVAIAPEAKEDPRTYQIHLVLAPPDQEKHRDNREYDNMIVDFPVYVGVREAGKLAVRIDKDGKPKIERCATGDKHTFKLSLHNGFRDYNVFLQRVEVTSEPPGLVEHLVATEPKGTIEGNVVTFDSPIIIEPSENKTIGIMAEIAGMSADKYIRGFGDDTSVRFDFVYEDTYGRRITDFHQDVRLNVLPSFRVLLISILLGALAGTLVTIRLGRLHQEGVITAKQKAVFILGTVVVGVIVSFVAMQGEVKFSTLYFSASYDKPFVLFIIGVAATVGGAPMLMRLLGLDASTKTTTTTNNPEQRTLTRS